jgi:cell division protein FtsA
MPSLLNESPPAVMFDPGQILVGLEIGTSKICVAVGEMTEAGELTILGFGQARSRGVRKGEIIDTEKASEDVREALAQAEDMANVEIESVYLAVTGNHIRALNNRGVHTIPTVDREITDEDVQDALRNAKSINCPAGYEIVDSVRQDFRVDDQAVYENPVGIVGSRVEASVHVIQGSTNRIATSRRVVEGPTPVKVEKAVFSGLASALAVLTNEQKDMGAIVLDLGGGTTEFALFHKGLLRHSGVLGVGGDHVSNDLSHGLRLPLGLAEELKIRLGAAVVGPAAAETMHLLAGTQGLPDRRINVGHLQRITSMRLEETMELIARDLAVAQLLRLAGAGVFLCGGGARVPGIETLAQRIFQLPVSRAHVQNVSGPADVLENPEFATATGLVRYGAMRSKQRPRRWTFPRLGSLAARTRR